MKRRILTIVKYYRWVYLLYYYIGTFVLKVLQILVKTDDDLILFVSFGGKKYNDSPLKIYERMCVDRRFENKKFVWAFREPEKFNIIKGEKVKIDTLQYYIFALKARCWITNSGIERGLSFRGKKTFYLNTWHGTPIKKMGGDICNENKSFRSNGEFQADVILAQGDYEIEIYSQAFGISKDSFAKIGYPRNDDLLNVEENEVKRIKERLGIPLNRKVILYAPTFREYERNSVGECIVTSPIDFSKWKKVLENKYIVLTRFHYEIDGKMDLDEYKNFVFDCTDEPNITDLMKISDLLISDYSSLMIDYAIMEKPIICFAYDWEKYIESRGVYFDITKFVDGGQIEEDMLLEMIISLNENEARKKSVELKRAFVNYCGNATDKALNIIEKGMLLNENKNS